MPSRITATCGLLLLVASSGYAGNWGHWRGELGNGVSLEAKPPVTWSETENVKWKVEIPGRGSGSPIVWENQVFVTTAVASDGGNSDRLSFVVMAIDRATGKVNWSQTAVEAVPHEGTHSTNTFASGSPCTDGEHLYAHFGSQGTYCYDLNGQLIWKRDLGDLTMRAGFGEGSSPTIVGDLLIVPWDHEGPSYVYALNKRTGETVWRTERDEPSCWATPLAISHGGKTQLILNGQNYARAYDAATGEELWRCGGQTQRPVASPVVLDDLVIVGSGFRGSFIGAFHLDGKGDIEGTSEVVWTLNRDTPDIPSPLLSENRLYYFKGKNGVLSCVNAKTGEPFYSAERVPLGTIYASPVAAAGHVYLCDRDGRVLVIKDSQDLSIVAENSLGETIDATPAPVDNQLFIRGESHLFCIEQE